MAKPDTRSLHQLLNAMGRVIGDSDATPEELVGLATAIRRRATQTAKDIEAIAEARANGHRQVKRAS